MVELDGLTRIALVADDDPLVVTVISAALEIDGWTVVGVRDGTTTLDAIDRVPLRLAIMDRQMPGPPLDVRLSRLAVRRPSAVAIVLSGDDDGTLPPDVVVLRKPVGLDDLHAGIARALLGGDPVSMR